jgi:ribosome silencing factor RsfS/YbeB/iojap
VRNAVAAPTRKSAPARGSSGVTPAAKAKPEAAEESPARPPRRAKAPKRAKLSPPQIELLVQGAVASLEDDKAEDIVVLDIASRASFADRMIVATGLADRQIQAMAGHLEKSLAEHGIKRPKIETSPDWVLIDAGDLIIHLFKPEARANYRLEKMWGPDSPLGEGSMPSNEDLPPETGASNDAGFAEAGFPGLEPESAAGGTPEPDGDDAEEDEADDDEAEEAEEPLTDDDDVIDGLGDEAGPDGDETGDAPDEANEGKDRPTEPDEPV